MKHKGSPSSCENSTDQLAILSEISRLVDSTKNADDILSPVLMMISDLYKTENIACTLFDKAKNEIYMNISLGLSDTEQMRGRYKPGEGITGNVFKSGKLQIVPKITLEPNFIHKTRSQMHSKECSFICIPIKYYTAVTGTLSVMLPYSKQTNLKNIAEFLCIVSTLIAQPLILNRQLREMETEVRIIHDEYHKSNFNTPLLTGNSRSIREIKSSLYQYAKSDKSVLIIGESGTGKTFIAHRLHAMSLRKSFPLIRCNINNILKGNIMKILFGTPDIPHQSTGNADIPLIKQADNTSLLIEEIHVLPLECQDMLYTILQTREITFHGSVEKIYARILLTTSENIQENTTFHRDLYALLAPHIITMPSLRSRKDDTMLLADIFLKEISKKQQKNIKRFSTPAIDLLCSYHWPGNLNELKQVIDHATRMCEGGVIHAHMFPPSLQSAESTNTIEQQGLHETISHVENDLIIDTLKFTRGNMKKSASILKVSERILRLRIKKYNITPSYYRR